jgi:Flp pilus assembly protein TadG
MRGKRNQRGGYVMVLLAMLLFGLMAMAALVIDLGFARLAHKQMQSAADAAALEGLRGEGDASLSYEDRQTAAEQLITWTFDDDLAATATDERLSGAGPIVNFSGGEGQPALNASQLMEIDPANATYKPVMQGRSSPTSAYQFRVAIQRGGEIAADYDLFSQGPAVPYLFARGSLISRKRVGSGINVGGVARAEARPAVRVWPANAGLNGIQPVAYLSSDWGASPNNALSITSDISGGLSIGQLILTESTDPGISTGYCAILEPATNRVVGFGMLGQASPQAGIVASHNASARLSDAWQELAVLNQSDRADVLAANNALQHTLQAPVLVRN